ncbi:calcium binding protein [Anaeramoeba flamelloides]|uniref:Calcium binding protein n=1 Tax=Anaeramoeba flamelloides TaxID=1746091 RepID=A0AAV7Y6I5_9EUKA|nr:calcium binding protein [Anaeramoeba flamelloides]
MSITKKHIKALKIRVKNLKNCKPSKCHLDVNDLRLLFGIDEEGASLLLKCFDLDNNGTIEWKELICGISTLSDESNETKAKYLFKLWDSDGNGKLDREEITNMVKSTVIISASLVASSYIQDIAKMMNVDNELSEKEFYLKVNKEIVNKIEESQITEIVNQFFSYADVDNDGFISKEEFLKYCKTENNTSFQFIDSIQEIICVNQSKKSCSIQ